ncbi:uncharacterized protein LOC129592788 [Paramacrobiotus metropolitanus]|uniref:uncharacterized protein LOC129592788 n=1 Tax=Paramacrobiotus metropolitanus TaxID=2943436 RepID=UPI00244609EF|nr:uncharacterized protein LOC129592788 [Paramacrobiotus metropolitanus]
MLGDQDDPIGVPLLLPWFLDASMMLADWILVVFSWERLLVIVSPFRFGFLQRVSTARIIIVLLAILSLACYMHDFTTNYITLMNDLTDKPDSNKPHYGYPNWQEFWDLVDANALIAVRILTFLLILIPSVILVAFLARHRRSEFGELRRLQRQQSASSAASASSMSQHGINIILLSSALLYLITRSLKCLTYAPAPKLYRGPLNLLIATI